MTFRVTASVTSAAALGLALLAGRTTLVAGVPDATWNANGATACEKFLPPDVTSAILVSPAGAAAKDDATSCHRGPIYLTLKTGNVSVFKQEMTRVVMAHAMTGVGDAAFWNPAGAVSSVKAPDRGCDISVLNAQLAAKVHDAALGQKLGEVCNKLFALK